MKFERENLPVHSLDGSILQFALVSSSLLIGLFVCVCVCVGACAHLSSGRDLVRTKVTCCIREKEEAREERREKVQRELRKEKRGRRNDKRLLFFLLWFYLGLGGWRMERERERERRTKGLLLVLGLVDGKV